MLLNTLYGVQNHSATTKNYPTPNSVCRGLKTLILLTEFSAPLASVVRALAENQGGRISESQLVIPLLQLKRLPCVGCGPPTVPGSTLWQGFSPSEIWQLLLCSFL